MASLIYDSGMRDIINAVIDVDAASALRVALMTTGYTPARSDTLFSGISANEVAAGAGYTAAGATVTGTVTLNAGVSVVITLPGSTWTTAAGQTLTAARAVWYVATGSRLIVCNDFGGNQIASNGGALTLPASTITITF